MGCGIWNYRIRSKLLEINLPNQIIRRRALLEMSLNSRETWMPACAGMTDGSSIP